MLESGFVRLPHFTNLGVTRQICRKSTLSSERVASDGVRIEPASVSPRHPRRRVDEQVAPLRSVTSTECTKPQVTIAAGVIKMMTRGRWWRDGLLSQSWLLPVGHRCA